MKYNPPHEVRDENKVKAMVATLQAGQTLPPVVVCGDNALSGVHRLAAYDALEMDPEVIEVSDADYCRAMESMGLDPMYDEVGNLSDLLDALVAVGALTAEQAESQD